MLNLLKALNFQKPTRDDRCSDFILKSLLRRKEKAVEQRKLAPSDAAASNFSRYFVVAGGLRSDRVHPNGRLAEQRALLHGELQRSARGTLQVRAVVV